MFICDFALSWYHVGPPGIGRELYSTRGYLRFMIEFANYGSMVSVFPIDNGVLNSRVYGIKHHVGV